MIDILRIILGSILALFLPGFLVVLIFFNEFKKLEKLLFSIAFSIMIDVGIAIYLGYNEAQAKITGGLTLDNIIKVEAYVIGFLLLASIIKFVLKKYLYKKEQPPKKNVRKTKKKQRS